MDRNQFLHHNYQKLIDTISSCAKPLSDSRDCVSSLIKKIGSARFVLIGEATHGTHEFYHLRAEITKELILQKGFMAVAIESNWSDAYRTHRYLQGLTDKNECEVALQAFNHFPTWRWCNTTLPPFLKWLREYNDQIEQLENKVGFYGIDLYDLYSSTQTVVNYLDKIAPDAARRAQARFASFDHVKPDPTSYGYLTNFGAKKTCLRESSEQLIATQQLAYTKMRHDGIPKADEYFYSHQFSRIVKNAEHYYRALLEGRVPSWNVRDKHMAESLHILCDHLENHFKKPAKIIVWAHNSHVGDTRATEMGSQGEINLGQWVREQHFNDTYLIGFSTDQGQVTAASDWGTLSTHNILNPGITGSYEALFHQAEAPNFMLDLHKDNKLEHVLHLPRLQRSIGMTYRPETERQSHYFLTRLPSQFDCMIHIDKTTAVKPLEVGTIPSPE